MRSSQSSRLADPMNTSGVIDPKFSTSSMVYYPHRKRLDEMGEIIKAKTNFVLPNISMCFNFKNFRKSEC